MQTKVSNKCLYSLLFAFAILDLVTGIISLRLNSMAWQITALVVTTITLILSIVYCIDCARINAGRKADNVGTVVVGAIDFATGLASVLIMVMTVQIMAVVASSLTFVKSLKIFIQSEKARELLLRSKPVITKVALKVAPICALKIVSQFRKIKNKVKNKEQTKTMKEIFKKIGSSIKSNLGTISMVAMESFAGGGIGYVLVNHILSTGLLPVVWSYVAAVAITVLIYAGVVALTVWIGSDSEASAKLRSLVSLLLKLIKGKATEEQAQIIDQVVGAVQSTVDQAKADLEKAKAAEEAEKQKAIDAKENAKIEAERLAKAKKLLAEKEAAELKNAKEAEKQKAIDDAKKAEEQAVKDAENKAKAAEREAEAKALNEALIIEALANKLAEDKKVAKAVKNTKVAAVQSNSADGTSDTSVQSVLQHLIK